MGDVPEGAGTSDVHLPDRHDVWRQVRYDLFETKDVQDTPTYSYAWIADQGGHFSLGFLPTYLLAWVVTVAGQYGHFDTTGWNVWIGAVVFGIWVVKELNDYRLARRNARRSKSDFPFNKRELLWNIFTAWLFFAMGSAVAALSFLDLRWALLSLVPVALITVRVSYWWLRRKITFQQANLPYLYRLATFPNNIPAHPGVGMGLAEAKKFIAKMIDPHRKVPDKEGECSGHLILSGVPDAGKSTLAVAIGTEFVFKLGLCRYLSMVKLLQFATDKESGQAAANKGAAADPRPHRPVEEFNDGRILWRWDKVELLIVDDVDDIARVQHDSNPHPTPEEVKAFNDRVKQVLQQRFGSILADLKARPRTVWVCNRPVNPTALKTILEDLLGYRDMRIINLEKSLPEARREKGLA